MICSQSRSGSGHKLQHNLQLQLKSESFTVRMIEHWIELAREVVICTFGDAQHPVGQSPEQPALVNHTWSQKVSLDNLELPFCNSVTGADWKTSTVMTSLESKQKSLCERTKTGNRSESG